MKGFFKTQDDWSGLVLRVMLGIVIFPHGAQKLLGWFGGYGFTGTLNFFVQQMHIPAVLVVLVIAAEFFGGLALIFGFLTRLAAFGVMCVMTGAIFLVHHQHGFFMNWGGNQQGEGFEYHLLAIGMALALLIAGGGKFSADRIIAGKMEK